MFESVVKMMPSEELTQAFFAVVPKMLFANRKTLDKELIPKGSCLYEIFNEEEEDDD